MPIRITNLLKQALIFSSNNFYGPFNADFAAMKASLVIVSSSYNSSSCSGSGGGSGRGSDGTSTCGRSSGKMSYTSKYKLGAIAEVRVGKHNLGTMAGKCKVLSRSVNTSWGPGLVYTN